jgi:hypothetical protein
MRIHEALTLAHELSHPFSLAFALGIRSWLSQLQGEPQSHCCKDHCREL